MKNIDLLNALQALSLVPYGDGHVCTLDSDLITRLILLKVDIKRRLAKHDAARTEIYLESKKDVPDFDQRYNEFLSDMEAHKDFEPVVKIVDARFTEAYNHILEEEAEPATQPLLSDAEFVQVVKALNSMPQSYYDSLTRIDENNRNAPRICEFIARHLVASVQQ